MAFEGADTPPINLRTVRWKVAVRGRNTLPELFEDAQFALNPKDMPWELEEDRGSYSYWGSDRRCWCIRQLQGSRRIWASKRIDWWGRDWSVRFLVGIIRGMASCKQPVSWSPTGAQSSTELRQPNPQGGWRAMTGRAHQGTTLNSLQQRLWL